MSDTPIVLSISMLVSGREEMEKSLVSLTPIREAVPSELILVDTGCSPEYRVIAEKYADRIIDFTWCNDFAAARNAGLKEARGEWFMYLDDDEWFEDPGQIVSFFTSGEYKRYGCASYIQRNYKDAEGKLYSDSYVSRLARLRPETKFEGRIHEYLGPYENPSREFADFVHHYGYVYKDEEEQRRHAQRNIQPLRELMKENPGEPRWVCQLAQEYLSLHEYEETFAVCSQGLREWKERAERENFAYVPYHVGGLYVYLLIALEVLRRYEEEADWLKKAFADPNMLFDHMEPTLAFLCALGAKLYGNLKDYRKCGEYFGRYLDYTKRFKDNRAVLESGAALIVTSVFQEPFLYPTILSSVGAVIRTENHKLAEDAFDMLDWQYAGLTNRGGSAKEILDALCSVEYHPVWSKLLQKLVSGPNGMEEMTAVFAAVEAEYRQQGEDLGRKKLSRLYRLAAELPGDNSYLLCARILWTERETGLSDEERAERMAALFGELFDRYGDEILAVRAEVWNAAERQRVSLSSCFSKVNYRGLKRALERWCRTASLWEIRQWDERIALWRVQDDLHFAIFEVKCAEGYLHCHREACPGPDKMEQALWRYAEAVLAMYNGSFREAALTGMPEILPEEVQLALGLKELREYRAQGDDLKSLECVKRCIGACSALESEMADYAGMLRDEVQRRHREAAEAQTELQKLIAALKRTARAKMDGGEYQAAREILLQVRQCAPDDREVEELLANLAEKDM